MKEAEQAQESGRDDEEFLPDYEQFGGCQFGVAAPHTMEGVADCGEPATHRIWWEDYDRAMLVCAAHFTEITKQPTELTALRDELAAVKGERDALRHNHDVYKRQAEAYLAELNRLRPTMTGELHAAKAEGLAALVNSAYRLFHLNPRYEHLRNFPHVQPSHAEEQVLAWLKDYERIVAAPTGDALTSRTAATTVPSEENND